MFFLQKPGVLKTYLGEFSLPHDLAINTTTRNSIKVITETITLDSNGYYTQEPKTSNYTITNDASTVGSAAIEGETVTFTITRENIGKTDSVYLSTYVYSQYNDIWSHGTNELGHLTNNEKASWATGLNLASESDIKVVPMTKLTFSPQEKTKTFNVQTIADSKGEGAWNENKGLHDRGTETFQLHLHESPYSINIPNNYKSSAYIFDTAPSDYKYTVVSNASSNNPIKEGDKITFTISRELVNPNDCAAFTSRQAPSLSPILFFATARFT